MIRTGLSLRLSLLAISFGWVSARAQDGERALLIVDPDNAESMYVAHYYQAAYDIPANHILYMDPGGDAGYADLVQLQLRAFLGTLSARGLEDSIDFVILPPGDHYKVSAPGLVSDGCVAVQQFSLPSAYSLARQSADILGGLPSSSRNHFANTAWDAAAFSGATAYRNGNPSTASNAERYFLGTMLGWTGQNGNTVSEILELIDRSVAVRGTQPVGTVYFMETTDVARSGPRQGLFPQAVVAMGNAGGVGQHLFDVLPLGHHDAMGVMTGAATPDILNLDYSLLPGSFADHLTSYAADLTNNSQAKMTLWLTKGASGTSGAIEEPCNYAGKFPTAALHTSYRQGATLGEAWFRHLAYAPFQTLFLGDSLTRPYYQAPTVSVPGAPTGPVTGTLVLTPQASASVPGASIAGVEL
ncbi:MAG TPA: hypothetical protein P5218_14445, partial [Planctomycetota bacterium]|nr:hypothetical protein [Planctomycetota bacterium]